MSEVVKKLVTELGFKLVDQATLKKYSNTHKDLLKTQKETNKATEKGLSLKQKEKQQLKENAKLETEKVKQQTRLELARLKQVEKSDKERNKLILQREKEVNKNKLAQQKRLDNYKKLEEKREIQKTKQEEQRQKQTEKLRQTQARQEEQRKRNQEALDNRITRTLEQNQRKLERKTQQQERDKLTRQYREGGRVSRADRKLQIGVNERLKPQGKQMLPNGQIVDIPKQSRFTYPTQSEKQSAREDIATNVGQRTVDVSWNIIKDSANTFLDFSNKMKELEVFGGLSKSELDIMKAQILSSSVKYGYKPTDVAEIGVGYSLAGVKGKSLTNITEVTTGTARAGRTTPQKAEEVLNSIAHQFGVDFEKFGEVAKMSDAIITVMNESKLGFEDVNTAMKYFGPMAQQMGMSLEDTLTLVGLWSQRGIKGSTPGTSGRQALIRTAQELANMWETGTGGEGSKGKLFRKKKGKMDKSTSLAELGVTKESVLDKKGKFNFFKLIEQLRGSFKKKGLNEYQKIGALTDIFGVIPSSALASLMKDYSKTDLSLIQHMANTGGAREKTATGLMGSQQMQVGQTQAKIDISKINLGATFSKDIDTLNLSISRLAETYNKSPALQSLSGDLLRIAGVGGALVGAAGGIRLLGLALGLPVFALGAPWILAITAISLGFNDIWNALNGRESYLLNVGNWFHKLGGSILNFLDTSIIPAIKYMDSLFQSVRNFLGLESNKTFNVDVVVKGGQQFGFSGGLPSSPKPTGAVNWGKTMNKSTATRAG